MLKLADSRCPESFDCGGLGTLEFPLTHNSEPECGLFVVDCQSTPPRIELGVGGSSYNILMKVSPNSLRVVDPLLDSQLRLPNCFLSANLSLGDSPFSSFAFSPNLTMWSCGKSPDRMEMEKIQVYFQNYKSYTNCSDFTLYYEDPANRLPSRESSIPENCSVLELPSKYNPDSSDPFQLLTAEFVLEWKVSADCLSCHHLGGKCRANSHNGFWCQDKGKSRKIPLIVGATVAALTSTSMLLLIFLLIRRKYIRPQQSKKDIELFLKDNGYLALKRYKYSDLKKMTKRFSENLGKGGYGSVYKGKLHDGRLVAVKVLNESKGNGDEFMNEVASISRTSHINIVSLLGFCFEGSKKALIYEFMPNGSLEKFIQNAALSSAEGGLGWEKLFEIAVGVARGLEYFHRGCNTRILHFDIKPHNILLDKDLNPKISDFGLAKLCPNRSSVVSMLVARGTIGYIAPEVFCRNFGEVSHKSDVYSYGMMVLEIAGGRKNIDPADVDHSSEVYFPNYIYKQLEMEAERGGHPDGIMNEDESQSAMRKLIIVGLWCIQTDPKDRPSMNKVVEMLEGKVEYLQVPPKPYLSSPPRLAPSPSISVSVP
ncbi:UNVERIFIED_CONTAM: LEAF RUST 10 DISEASE-RESISTANCE LOCUS RECEPTOR-LIKE PROTEIN KINASE-like 2.8 [Sesamum radiatum]|uniref:LEAF RUST 10 DISEASE-RESISTANCE LOCUS RECEPTOR-LIKE PROTEIN KINASE-like 2.8 n=1 Tax=Sesamum radiatum TaxID=300843 RepID=A0AAW2V738_SESRA